MNFTPIPNRPDLDKRDTEHLTKLDLFSQHLIATLTVLAAYECPLHNPKQPCKCPKAMENFPPATKDIFTYIHFVQAWEQYLLSNDAAFLFRDTYQGKKGFSALNARKTPPSIIAVAFAKRTFAPGMLAPMDRMETTIGAMLSFWDDRASNWNSKYPSKEAARRDLKACMPGDPGYELYGIELDKTPAKHQFGQGLLIPQRIHRIPIGDVEQKHNNTVFLMPLLPRLGNSCVYPRHKLLGMRRCHANCNRSPPTLLQSEIEDFRRSCFGGDTRVNWGYDALQRSILNVEYTDPVDGAA